MESHHLKKWFCMAGVKLTADGRRLIQWMAESEEIALLPWAWTAKPPTVPVLSQCAQSWFLCSSHQGGLVTGRTKANSDLIKKWQESIKRPRETVNSNLSGSCYDNRNKIQH